jgi:hypothetical protein
MSTKNEILDGIIASVKEMTVEEYNALYEKSLEKEDIRVIQEEYEIEFSHSHSNFTNTLEYLNTPRVPIFIESKEKEIPSFIGTLSLAA